MDLGIALIIMGAGAIAGVINGVVGGASLLTFPLLVATGTPPVMAAASNTVGLSAANATALLPHRHTMRAAFGEWRSGALATGLGALVGGGLLILLPERVFEIVVPAFILFASLSMLRPIRAQAPHENGHARTPLRLLGAGAYSGYFGPGIGVIIMAVLARDGRLDMRGITVIKNYTTMAANLAASTLFIVTGHVQWTRVLPLMLGATIGGYIGGHASKRFPAEVLRWLVVVIGLFSAGFFAIRLVG